MAMAAPIDPMQGRARPGGRSARVRAVALTAMVDLVAERGYEQVKLPAVAQRAGVSVSTVYRLWGSSVRLAGEALLERWDPLVRSPVPGALRTDLEQLLIHG